MTLTDYISKRNTRDTYYLRSKLTGKYILQFYSFSSLLAYLAHFNTYIDRDHPIIDRISCGINNNTVVNYYIGIRLCNTEKEIIDKANFKKKTIKKLIKNCGIQLDNNGNIVTNDLEIVDCMDNIVKLDKNAIKAVLDRYCNSTDFKSVCDMPNFIYRSTPVPNILNYNRYRCRSRPKIIGEARFMSDPSYKKYSRAKRAKLCLRYSNDNLRNNNWKKFGKWEHQWSAKASRKA